MDSSDDDISLCQPYRQGGKQDHYNENKQNCNDRRRSTYTDIQGYALHEVLGKGSFGEVFKATKNKQSYAIKMIDKRMIRARKLQRYVNNEVRVMRELDCEHTLRLFEAFEDEDVLYLVIELCNGGTLFTHVLRTKPGEAECIRIFAQIMRGFKEIHAKEVLHRDLKPSNIFIKNGVFKIADFGLSSPKAIGSSYCGTSYFMAPEILQRRVHDYKVDLWSMGVILFFMVFREYPFKNSASLLDEIITKTSPNFDVSKCLKQKPRGGGGVSASSISTQLHDLFQKIFVVDPKSRISFHELYKLPMFSMYFSQDELRESTKKYQQLEQATTTTTPSSSQKNQANVNSAKEPVVVSQQQQTESNNNTPATAATTGMNASAKEEIVRLKTSKFKPNQPPTSVVTGGQAIPTNNQQPTTITSIQNNNGNNSQISISKIPSNFSLLGGVAKINSPLRVESNNFNNLLDQNRGTSSRAINSRTNFEYVEVKISYSTYSIRHSFGPKTFFHTSILPQSKAQKSVTTAGYLETANNCENQEDIFENSIPNAPSSFNHFFSNHNLSAQNLENPFGSSNNIRQVTSLNNIMVPTAQKRSLKHISYDNVSEEDKDDDDSDDDDDDQDHSIGMLKGIPSMHIKIIDSAVKDKLRKQIIEECEAVFDGHVSVYLHEIGIYSVLGEAIHSLGVLNMSSATQSLVNYILAKLLLFYAQRLKVSLQTQTNIFELSLFNTFSLSPTAQLIIGKIDRDIDQWMVKFNLFYYGIDQDRDIHNEDVRRIVTDECTETSFENQLKLPSRIVLDIIFKASYKMGKASVSQIESCAILRTSMLLLISMLINSVFEKNRVKENFKLYFEDHEKLLAKQNHNNPSKTPNAKIDHLESEKPIDFVEFSMWMMQATKETLLKSIHHLVVSAFGKKKLQALMF